MNKESTRVATYLPVDILEKLTKKASDAGLSESAYIRTLIIKDVKK